MNRLDLKSSERADDEIAALITRLHETEQRLEQLTEGEVDTVADPLGRPYLLRRAQEDFRNREADKQAAILNALPVHIALLDSEGVIVSVNDLWRNPATANDLQGPAFGIGLNYLDVCDRSGGNGSNDAPLVAAGIRSVLAGASSFSLEYACSPSAGQRWFLVTVTPLNATMAPGAVIMHQNITARRRAEEARRESRKRLRHLIDGLGTTMMVGLMTPDGILIEANAPALAVVGCKSEDVLGQAFVDSPWFTHSAAVRQQLRDAIARGVRGEASRYDIKVRGSDGQLIDVDFVLNPVRDESGQIVFLVPSGNVITERKRAEIAIRESNEKFHQLADNITDAFWIRSPDLHEVQYVSPAFETIWGRTVASLLANPHAWSDFVLKEDRPAVQAAFDGLTDRTPRIDIEYRIVRPDGEVRWVRVRGFQIRDVDDALVRHVGIVTDITERKQAETDRQWKTAFLEAQVASSLDGILVVDENGMKSLQNQRMIDLFAIPRTMAEDKDDQPQRLWVTGVTKHPEAFAEKVAYLNAHPNEVSRDEIELKNGTTLDRYSAPMLGVDGKYYGRIWTFRDITERKQSMGALRASKQIFKAFFDQAAVGVAQLEAATGKFVQVNQRFADLLGRSQEDLYRLKVGDVTHPHDMDIAAESSRQLYAGTIREDAREMRYRRKDGSDVWVSLSVSAMWYPGELPSLCIAVVQDITERKRLDEHFLQAQKMEALGQFSGGVAHDFNNILTTICGYAELSLMAVAGDSGVRMYLNGILKASRRAADLVKQILTFSRQQPQQRHVIQLKPVIEECIKLLRSTLPSTIEFDAVLPADAPTVLANANQINQVLTNLGINAWHAMSEGPGRLRFTLEKWTVDDALNAVQGRLRPGEYARVSVRDSGSGMDAATQRRIFEPFFTTKPPGQGTGLGLAVVHGIMDSHDGAITVYSQPDEGTVFHLYFPANAGEAIVAPAARDPLLQGRGETILVVDDEEMIADLLQQTLVRLGYVAEFTTDAATALARVKADPARFHLVLSDQTMPGMTGLMLATDLKAVRADLPVILMTGFSTALTPARLQEAGVRHVVFKPIAVQELSSALHRILAPAA